MKHIVIFVLVIVNCLSFAARPLKSNDAFNLGKYAFQLEIASDIITLEDYHFSAFPVTITYGLTDATDLFIGSLATTNRLFNGNLYFDCIDVGFKQNIVSSEDFNFSFASGLSSQFIDASISSPSAFFNLITSISTGDISFHYNLGYNQNFNAEEFKDLWFTSLGIEYQFTEKIILAADFGLGRDPSIHCTIPKSYGLIGASYNIFNNFSFDTGISFSFQHTTKVEMLTTGLTFIL